MLLIERVDLFVVVVDVLRTKEVIVLTTLQYLLADESFKVIIDYACDVLEGLRMVDLKDLE